MSTHERPWKFLSIILVGLLTTTCLAAVFQLPQQLQQYIGSSGLRSAFGAGALTNVFAMPSNNLIGGESYYTIAFTTASAGAVKNVETTFPAGFNINSVRIIEVQNIAAGTVQVSGQTLTYQVSGTSPPTISAGTAVKIMVARIVNPTATLTNTVSIATKTGAGTIIDGPTNSVAFTLSNIGSSKLADNAVTSAKIVSGAVTSSDIADNTVGTLDIGNGAVTGSDIANGAVTSGKLGVNSVSSSNILDSSITSQDIASGAIQTSDVATTFIKNVVLTDSPGSNALGWNPDGAKTTFVITDSGISAISSIFLRVQDSSIFDASNCTVGGINTSNGSTHFSVRCDNTPNNGSELIYTLVNAPTQTH